MFQNRVYLFVDERTRQTFEWDPERYVMPDGTRRLQPVVAGALRANSRKRTDYRYAKWPEPE
jgi:hypothetical protein